MQSPCNWYRDYGYLTASNITNPFRYTTKTTTITGWCTGCWIIGSVDGYVSTKTNMNGLYDKYKISILKKNGGPMELTVEIFTESRRNDPHDMCKSWTHGIKDCIHFFNWEVLRINISVSFIGQKTFENLKEYIKQVAK